MEPLALERCHHEDANGIVTLTILQSNDPKDIEIASDQERDTWGRRLLQTVLTER